MLLTIAIPTYNRAGYLDLCLSQIERQIRGHESEVELIVSNNCSTDGTDEVVGKYGARGLAMNYLRNDRNIGGDPNFLQCFRAARGKYFLLFSDDDVLLDGSLETILEVLRGDYGVIHLKSYSYREDFRAERPRKQPLGRPPKFVLYDDPAKFIDRINVMLTFISGNIVNKSHVAKDMNFDAFVGTSLVQLSWTLSALLNADRNVFVDGPMLAAKAENTTGTAIGRVFGVNMNRVFGLFVEKGADPGPFKAINRKVLRSFFPNNIIKLRRELGKRLEEDFYETLHPVFRSYAGFWLVTWPAIKLPLPLARAWQKGCKKYFKLFKMV